MIPEKDTKVNRILEIYTKLIKGEVVNVSEKTIQRDLDDIRAYFYDYRENHGDNDIIYRRDIKGYCLDNNGDVLTRKDVLAIMKILLESRAFCKDELNHLTNTLLKQIDYEQRKNIKNITSNELLNYVSPQHNELLLTMIWDISELIKEKEITEITYIKTDGAEVKRTIKPVAIIFSEYYFYLIAYYNDFNSPTVFRVDRIKTYKKKGNKFHIPESERFEDGEFRKRVQFMYPGKLMKIKFEFTGPSIEAVLDRLPTAKIIESSEGKYVVEAEVYGKGIIMWILSQGKGIKVISPASFCKEVLKEIEQMKKLYE